MHASSGCPAYGGSRPSKSKGGVDNFIVGVSGLLDGKAPSFSCSGLRDLTPGRHFSHKLAYVEPARCVAALDCSVRHVAIVLMPTLIQTPHVEIWFEALLGHEARSEFKQLLLL